MLNASVAVWCWVWEMSMSENAWLTRFWLPKMKFNTTTKLLDYMLDPVNRFSNCFQGNWQTQRNHAIFAIPWERERVSMNFSKFSWSFDNWTKVSTSDNFESTTKLMSFAKRSLSFMLIEHICDIYIHTNTHVGRLLSCFQQAKMTCWEQINKYIQWLMLL